ncbi:MAG: RNA polymerase sigma factor, partial [Planctomycetota bacterium]
SVLSSPPPSAPTPELLDRGFRYALSLTGRRADAEDVLHEACVSLARRGGPWEAGLLFRAVRHRFIDEWRRAQRRPGADLSGAGIPGAGVPGAVEALSGREDGVLARLMGADAVARALGELGADEREAAYLAWVEGYTAREVGRLTGRPRNTVLSHLHRARRKLRDRLVEGTLERKADV